MTIMLDNVLPIELVEEEEMIGQVDINGVWYHVQALTLDEFTDRGYCVDSDPDYEPQLDEHGFIYVFSPYSR